ncbi:aspartyl/asparaginyl beta-hydroxylase [Nonlabens dokdonensis]|uniref:Aspartyl/Asparaginyl beta-hydroxylase n=2 Tax=Nonlabens dokdonensis TaxID=328515 RepID=L7WE64_NONDD|nr:aspartyl/asparaginyl beta-hydroxylase domain-containing protein [Nonlabens dokdonensis]AGC78582.1 aspartyl/Asparaginyl beta-hydroxylase [Nonlabens dokdonensis DSW-6]PZX39288.1 aspartyl/asparaginyl beta-hydroxylase [Nonlabens dokdonensis]
MQNRTKHLQLPFKFDKEKLEQDLDRVLNEKWVPHFNTNNYSGEWNVISLFAKGGDATNIFALQDADASITTTEVLKQCSYLKSVIDSFKCPILTARILRLGAGAEIKPHRDHELGYEDGNFRLHIPITTNPDVEFILDGDRLIMLPGECWYTNVNYVHSVKNSGDQDRIHLVIDAGRNEWSDQLFFSLAPKDSFDPLPEKEASPETIQRMIEELKNQNTPAAIQMIKELSKKQVTSSK